MSTIQTSTGAIAPAELGFTLMHEHLLWDQSVYHLPADPNNPEEAFLFRKVCMEDLGRIRYAMHQHRDNTIHHDEALAAKELRAYAASGGRSFLDCSVLGVSRHPEAAKRISQESGVQIIEATGYYIKGSCPEAETLSMAEKEAAMLQDLTKGIDGTDVLAGVIGELGVSEAFYDCERDTLTAGARAHAQTGAAILIHQPGLEKKGHEILDVLQNGGAALTKVVLCHCDPVGEDTDYLASLADRGVTLSFDQFGTEFYLHIAAYNGLWLPRDADRIQMIAKLCKRGYAGQLVLAHDLCFKASYETYGGYGYRHIAANMLPQLRGAGVTDAEIRQMMVENPARILAK